MMRNSRHRVVHYVLGADLLGGAAAVRIRKEAYYSFCGYPGSIPAYRLSNINMHQNISQ